MFLFTDCVIEQIGKEIAAYLPERGGALLGPPASPLISVLLFDAQASVTGASYLPSGDLVRRVADMERTEGLQFKGVIHSHPGSSDKPSGQDCYAFRRGLDLNPGLAAFLAPIVTLDRPARSGRENEVAVTGSSRMTVYAAYRAPIDVDRGLGSEWYPRLRVEVPARELVIDTPPCQVIPVGAHTAELTAMLGQRGELVGSVRWGTLAFNGAHFLSASFVITANEVIVLFPPTYPISKPAILVTKIDEDRANDTKEVPLGWGLLDGTSLWAACGSALAAALAENWSGLPPTLIERRPGKTSGDEEIISAATDDVDTTGEGHLHFNCVRRRTSK